MILESPEMKFMLNMVKALVGKVENFQEQMVI